MIDIGWDSTAGLLAGWLLTYAIHSTLLLGLAWLLTRRGMFASYHVAEILWKAALVGGVITATAQIALGIAPLGGYLNLAWTGTNSVFTVQTVSPMVQTTDVAYATALPRPDGFPFDWPLWVIGLWGAGACLGMVRWLIGRRQLETFLWQSKRRRVSGTPLALMLRRLCRRAGIKYRVRLTSSSWILSPIALENREICVPERAITDLSTKQQESMLAHELAHVARHDAMWRLAAELIQAVFFFQPLNWVARRRLQEIAEYLCDDWAVRQTGGHLSLAQCLAEVATWIQQQAQPIGASGLTGKPSLLVGRVTRLVVSPERRHVRISEFWGKIVMVGVLLAVIGLAPAVSVPVTVPLPPSFGIGMGRMLVIRGESGSVTMGTFQQAVPIPPPPVPPPGIAAP